MDIAAAQLIWSFVGGYFAVGVIVATALAGGLVRRFDPLAADAPLHVRLFFVPGMAALWPILAVKALRNGKTP